MSAPPLCVLVPIRTAAGLNNREHWSQRHRRVLRERQAVALLWPRAFKPALPVHVRLVRVRPSGPGLDDDNLGGSLKSVRDEVAKRLGVDDADPRVSWAYAQGVGPWGVRIVVASVDANGYADDAD